MSIFTPIPYADLVNTSLNSNQTITTLSSLANTALVPAWIRILTLTCMILIDISVFFGNLLVICAFFRTRRLQTVTNYFIASLAFADALVAIFVLPLSIYYYQHDRSWKLGLILCDLWVSSDVLLCTSSILNLTCISVDRYMAITRPLTYTAYRSKFLARIMILLVWITSIVITCPPIFGWRDSNRKHTVEQEHKCDLNTARGYVVYSALGSFYIPAFIMIFVYMRIFMVVYSRENLMQSFHDKDSNTTTQGPSKPNQNGLTNTKSSGNIAHDNNDDNDNNIENLNKTSEKSSFSCCCSHFYKKIQQNNSSAIHQTSSSPFNSINLNTEQKLNGHLKPRSATNNDDYNNQNNFHLTRNGSPLTCKITTTASRFCRPCTLPTGKTTNSSNDPCHRRRKYILRIGAQYQFRTCDSPCYELKQFQNSLPSLIKSRSHSFDRSLTKDKGDSNTEFTRNQSYKAAPIHSSRGFNDKEQNETNDTVPSNKQTTKSTMELVRSITQSLNELTHGKMQSTSNECATINEMKRPIRLSKCLSLTEQSITDNCSIDPNAFKQKSLPERRRIHRGTKSTRSATVSEPIKSIENLHQQQKTPLYNNSSIKSNYSIGSVRRNKEININKSKFPYFCCLCFKPLYSQQKGRNKQTYCFSPNQSLTYDEDYDDEYDEKLSSNDANSRATIIMTSSASLRAIESPNNTNTATSLQRHYTLPTGISQNSSHDANRRARIRFMREQKTAKTLAVVVGGFILFWLPFFIMYVIPPETYSFNPLTVTLITWLGYFNSIINPFIYAYCSKQFRMAFWNITFGVFTKKSNNLPAISVKNRQLTRNYTTR